MARGSGGGGRSGGGFGGRRSSGGFSRAGRSSRSFSSSGSFSSGSSNRSTFSGTSSASTRRSYGSARSSSPVVTRGNGSSGSGGCLTTVVAFLIVVIFLVIVFSMLGGGSSGSSYEAAVPENTTARTALSGVVSLTDWYRDDIGWIGNPQKLIPGLEHFYNKTGVQPFVWLVPYSEDFWNGDILDYDAADGFLGAFYDESFTDEGHLIFAYFEHPDDSRQAVEGEVRFLFGYAVNTIMDLEAQEIFEGYYFKNYDDLSLSFEEMISNTFSETADSIMTRPTNGWDALKAAAVPIAVVLVAACAYFGYKLYVKRRREKEEYTRKILDTELETFGDDTSELEEKYK